LLIWNHLLIFPNKLLLSFVNSVRLCLVTIILVSSTNKTGLDILGPVYGRSFIYSTKKVLSIQPGGTPCLTKPNPEMIVLKYISSVRTLRYIVR